MNGLPLGLGHDSQTIRRAVDVHRLEILVECHAVKAALVRLCVAGVAASPSTGPKCGYGLELC
jgi:hypothetical protein